MAVTSQNVTFVGEQIQRPPPPRGMAFSPPFSVRQAAVDMTRQAMWLCFQKLAQQGPWSVTWCDDDEKEDAPVSDQPPSTDKVTTTRPWDNEPCCLEPFLIQDADENDEQQPTLHRFVTPRPIGKKDVQRFVWRVDELLLQSGSVSSLTEYTDWHIEFAGHLSSSSSDHGGTMLRLPRDQAMPYSNIGLAAYCARVRYDHLHIARYLRVLATDGKLRAPPQPDPEDILHSGLSDSTRCVKCGSKASTDNTHSRGADEGPNTSTRCHNPMCNHVEKSDSR